MPDNIEAFFRLRPRAVWRDKIPGLPDCAVPEMVTLAPGRFLMGAATADKAGEDDERPQHEVSILYTIALSRYLVTFAEWDAAIEAGAKIPRQDDKGAGRSRRPVMLVSWQDTQDYIDWLNAKLGLTGRLDAYRLPTEAEWEFGCRAGSTNPFSFGETISEDQANFDSAGSTRGGRINDRRHWATRVDRFPANGFGLHDMHGNVWERCADRWHDSYGEPGRPDNGDAWLDGDSPLYVIRGGSWLSKAECLRSSHRGMIMQNYRNIIIGFRLARTLE